MSDEAATVARPATPMAQQIAEHETLLDKIRNMSPAMKAGQLTFFILTNVVMNGVIGYLLIDGFFDDKWYDFRDLGIGVGKLGIYLDGLGAGPWLAYWVTALIGALGIISFVGGVLLIGSWVERRMLARFQIRRGPNRVGPFGLLQPIADALKLLQKEVLIPRGADRFLYFLPPVLIFIPAILAWGPVPWNVHMTYLDVNVGVLYVIAITSLGVLAIFIAGWSSNNHYALLGAMRTVAMMISYEIPASLSLLTVVLLTGSLRLSEIVQWQADHNTWLIFLLPFAAFTFFFASTAEINRTPIDIAEAESEIVAGYHTEYSGMKAGLFLAVELGNAMVVGALVATLFLGGYTAFGLQEWVPGYLILFAKIGFIYFILIWLRATLPRFRLDQLMKYAWKFLIPISIANIGIVAVEVSILARWDVEGIISLGTFGIINLIITVFMVRGWARAIGYGSGPEAAARPTLTTALGGLKAVERVGS